MLRELETAITAALATLETQGYYVLGAPTDHQSVGRVGKKGEVRVAYQSRDWQKPQALRIEGKAPKTLCTIRFEVILELQDVRLDTHGIAAEAMEAIVTLLAGYNPDNECGSGLYPVRDGFVGRNSETATWIYSAVFALERQIKLEAIA